VRTDPEALKHKGISIIIVPTDAPGFRVVPIRNMGNTNTNQTFYDDVRVPAENLVGKLNGGWKLITSQLNHERVTLCSSGMIEGPFDDVVRWAKETRLADGRRVIDQPWVQLNVAKIHARLEFLRLMNFKVAWGAEQGQPMNPAHASTIKVFGTEFYLEACRLMLEVLGPAGTFRPGSPEVAVHGRIGFLLRTIHILTFGGGTNEMQRDLIALFGLGMPVQPRF
ncbi:MAG: acyl-CoA dehydrogenase family protein, partial [Candidatus Binatia bacterium]